MFSVEEDDDDDGIVWADTTKPRTLSSQIHEKCVESKFDDRRDKFLPAGCVDTLITREAIEDSIPNQFPLETYQTLINFVLWEAKVVFAITIDSCFEEGGIELAFGTYHLMKVRLTDASLPATEDHLKGLVAKFKGKTPWHQARIEKFCEAQWRFLAPVFSTKNFKHDLEPRRILPFIEKASSTKQGAFGKVFRVTVHEHHYLNPIRSVSPLYSIA